MSSMDNISRNSSGRRLLRLCLTDGHSEITAVEYSHIPFIPDSVVPGTKVTCDVSFAVTVQCQNFKSRLWSCVILDIAIMQSQLQRHQTL